MNTISHCKILLTRTVGQEDRKLKIIVIIDILIMLAMAVAWDLRSGRIPNKLNGFWIVYGLLTSLVVGGIRGLTQGLAGVLIPVLGLMILFHFRVIGAGDIKLLAGVGAFVGADVFWIIIYSFLLCGIYGAVLVVIRLIKGLVAGGIRAGIIGILARQGSYTRVAFSLFILGGFLWYLMKGGMLLGV